jgi:signal transduction histidine kinase
MRYLTQTGAALWMLLVMNDWIWHEQTWAAAFAIAALVSATCIGAQVAVWLKRERGSIRAQARQAERTRVARDLHDTTLQGIHAVLLKLETWTADERIASHLRQDITDVLAEVRRIETDARARILELRQGEAPIGELIEKLQSIAQLAQNESPASYFVETRGMPRALTPEAYYTLLDVAREAVQNACRHSGATRVEVQLAFYPTEVLLCVVDDGHGLVSVPGELLLASGHFGLLGMHERAADLGALLTIESEAGCGCRVQLRVPGKLAFSASIPRMGWFQRARTSLTRTAALSVWPPGRPGKRQALPPTS